MTLRIIHIIDYTVALLCALVSFVVFPLNVYFAAFLFLLYIYFTQNIHRDFINRTDDKTQNKIINSNVFTYVFLSFLILYFILYFVLGVIFEDTELVKSTIFLLYRDMAVTDLFSIPFYERYDELNSKYGAEYALRYFRNYLVFNFIFAVLFVLFFPRISSATISGKKIIELDQFGETRARTIAKSIMAGMFFYFMYLGVSLMIANHQFQPYALARSDDVVITSLVKLRFEYFTVKIYGIGAFLVVLFPMFLASQKSKHL